MLVVVASRNRNGGQSIVFAEKQGCTAKKDRESIFDFISDFAVVACDLQLILTLGNHAMILQLIKNHVMILQ